MSSTKATYYSKLFRDFAAIPSNEYRQIVRFYERHEQAIRQLDFEEYFALLMHYTDALFEVAAYQKHLLMADIVIETAVISNVRLYQGEDVFERHLFRKAASLYYLMQYREAIVILEQLVKINPNRLLYARFWSLCASRLIPTWLHQARAASIFLLLLSALLIAIELLFVRPFYSMFIDSVEWSRTALFLGGVLSLAGSEGLHRWLVYQQIRAVAQKSRQYKTEKKQ